MWDESAVVKEITGHESLNALYVAYARQVGAVNGWYWSRMDSLARRCAYRRYGCVAAREAFREGLLRLEHVPAVRPEGE